MPSQSTNTRLTASSGRSISSMGEPSDRMHVHIFGTPHWKEKRQVSTMPILWPQVPFIPNDSFLGTLRRISFKERGVLIVARTMTLRRIEVTLKPCYEEHNWWRLTVPRRVVEVGPGKISNVSEQQVHLRTLGSLLVNDTLQQAQNAISRLVTSH